MKIQTNCLLLIALFSSLTLLSGCMTPSKNMIPKGGDMTMPEIYKQETGISLTGEADPNYRPRLNNRRADSTETLPEPRYVAYTATAENEVKSLFKPLPNPEIPLYIYPHLVHVNDEAYPKPGLTTDFFLYRTNHFAMPNEVY